MFIRMFLLEVHGCIIVKENQNEIKITKTYVMLSLSINITVFFLYIYYVTFNMRVEYFLCKTLKEQKNSYFLKE